MADYNIEIKDIFSLHQSVGAVDESDYDNIEAIIQAAIAFERVTYQSVYIIDYYKLGFLYVSENISRLCGSDASSIKDGGYKFYTDFVPEDDLKKMLEINNGLFNRFNELPIEEREYYTVSYNFHIKNGIGYHLINHKFTPIKLTHDGRIWLAMCTISLPTSNKVGDVVMKRAGGSSYFQYSFDNHRWVKHKEVVLSEKEREILSMTAQGFTIADIADFIDKSIDTVKARRRKIFEKLNVKNIAEAITYAQNHQLI